MLGLILAAGVVFTVRSGFYQLRRWPGQLRGALRRTGTGVSPLQALSASLAGSIGTGNLLGVAAALTTGGAGAVVWMWISAFFGMMTVYAESVLAARYRQQDTPGALGYIQRVFRRPGAWLYAAGCVGASLGMGTMAQTGAVAAPLGAVGVPPAVSGALLAVLLLVCVRGGLQKAVHITEKLVPAMSVLFLLAAGAVLVRRWGQIPQAFSQMVQEAFSFRAGTGGVLGGWAAVRAGVSRGVFSNEAGLGSGAFALSKTGGKTPEQLGVLGALQVFLDTIVLCTVTALVLLVSPGAGEGAAQVLSAFGGTLGGLGQGAVSLSMALFAFATVVAWSCYGLEAVGFLFPGRVGAARCYCTAAAAAAFLGCLLPFSGVLSCCDLFNGLMALVNVPALLCLSKTVFPRQRSGVFSGIAKKQ